MNARLKHFILKSLATTVLGCSGTFLAAGTASANSQQICLIAPSSNSGGAIFVRDENGASTGEKWPNFSLGESFDVPGQDSASRFVLVSLSTGEQGYVSKSVIASADKCLHPQSPSVPATPPAAPTPDLTGGNIEPTGPSSDPFHCDTGKAVEACNRDALARYASAGKHITGYTDSRTAMFQKIDVYTDSTGTRVVRSVYSQDVFKVGAGIPDANNGGVNTEHTWPQSKLKQYSSFETTRADLYHLYPSDAKTNGERGNFPFAECSIDDNNEGHLCGGNSSFEPPNWHKGEVARALFYMSTTYSMPIDPDQEKTLRSWNAAYPVTDAERARAQKIFQYQGNHNPFIEHPEWIGLISDF